MKDLARFREAPTEFPVSPGTRPPVTPMELEPGVHVTLKFHLPWSLINGGDGAKVALDLLVLHELDRLLESLRKPREDNKNG